MSEDKAAQTLSHEGDAKSPGSLDDNAPRYRAFVSYRHADIDSKVAAAVQSGLERFYVPKQVRGSWDSARIAPVFRDKEELPVSSALGDDIDAALRGADAFVLICSPRTEESTWVAREIELYLKYHGRDHMFVVLAEGEPANVIPQRLLYETRQFEDSDGAVHEELVEVEPLACDFRESAKRERRTELTRLAAAILGVSFDTLNRRTQRRRMRIGAAIAAVVTAVALGVAGYALWSNTRIQESYRQALQQQSQYLTTAAQESLDDGDRLAAIELASAALPDEGEDRPFYPDAMQTLAEALHAYDDGRAIQEWASAGLAAKYQMAGSVRCMATSEDGHYLAAFDGHGDVRVWNLETDEPIFRGTYHSNNPNGASLLVTDDGLLALGCDSVITCIDILEDSTLWSMNIVQDAEGAGEYESAHAPGYSLQLADQDHAIALANKGAYLLDLRTGEVEGSVPYEENANDNVEFYPERLPGGWDSASKRLVICCNRYVSEGEDLLASDGSDDCECLVLSFQDGSSYAIEEMPYATDALFLEGDTLLVAGYESDESLNKSAFLNGGSGLLQTTQVPYTYRTVCIDLRSKSVRWSDGSVAYQVVDDDELLDLGGEVGGYEDHHVVAHCFANVCELVDVDDGKVLRRWETTAPIALVWPDLDEGFVLDGVLNDGSCFAVRIYEDIPQSFNNPSFYTDTRYVHSASIRLPEDVLICTGNTIYRYADTLEGDASREIVRYEGYVTTYSTACGLLMSEPVVDDKGYSIGMRLSLLDAVNGGVAWSKEYTRSDEYYDPIILGDLTNSDHLYLQLRSQDIDKPDRLVVVNLANGDESSLLVVGDFEEELPVGVSLLDTDPLVATHYAVSSIEERISTPYTTDGGKTAYHTDSVAHLARTDLLTGESTTFPFADLSEYGERFSEAYVDIKGGSLSPTGRHVVIPIEGISDDWSFDTKSFVSYGVIDLDTHEMKPLSPELRTDVYGRDGFLYLCSAVWADDGACFVAATEDDMVVFDTNGSTLTSLPIGNRKILSLHVQDGRLFAVCEEEDAVVMLVYEVETGNSLGRCAMKGANATLLFPEKICWIKSGASERNPGDLSMLADDTLYVISFDPLGICQVVKDCAGYDDAAKAFVVKKAVPMGEDGENGEAYRSYPRHSIDDLLQWGQTVVGASAMTDAERQSYGLDVSE